MSETNRKLPVFLCHASQDKPVVRELYQRLLAEGWIDPWLDEEKLLPGQDWDMEIEKAVEAAGAVVVFISSNSVSKEGYIQRELRFVLDIAFEKPEGTIFVIPLRLDKCELPRRLRSWHYVDYFPSNHKNQAYKRFLRSLRLRAQKIENLTSIFDEEKTSKETVVSGQKEKITSKKKYPSAIVWVVIAVAGLIIASFYGPISDAITQRIPTPLLALSQLPASVTLAPTKPPTLLMQTPSNWAIDKIDILTPSDGENLNCQPEIDCIVTVEIQWVPPEYTQGLSLYVWLRPDPQNSTHLFYAMGTPNAAVSSESGIWIANAHIGPFGDPSGMLFRIYAFVADASYVEGQAYYYLPDPLALDTVDIFR